LEANERKKRQPNGKGPEESFSQGTMEQIALANHILRARALFCPLMPWHGMHDLQIMLSRQKE
jgi:hypothetical protein